ncbi:MAG: ATP-binding protein, partial [Elusimicrobiaceae bacterium]
ATLANLEEFIGFIEKSALAANFMLEKVMQINLAVEEAYTNICKYAYPHKPDDAQITCYLADEQTLIVEITDNGVAFDITSSEKPDTSIPIEDRAIGGLGGLLIKEMSDRAEYERTDTTNILRLTFINRKPGDAK